MTRWLGYAVLAGMALSAWAGQASAQGVKDLELTAFGACSAWTNKEFTVGFPQASPPASGKFHFSPGFRGGLRLNTYSAGHWGEEFFYSFEHNGAHFFEATTPVKQIALGAEIHNFGLDGLYYFNPRETAKTRTYLAFGVGGTVFRPTSEGKAIAQDPASPMPGYGSSSEFAFNYGMGVKTRLSSSIGVRLDARQFIAKQPAFSFARHSEDPLTTVFPVTGSILNFEASAGIVFYLRK